MVMQCETAGAHVALVDIMMPRYDGFQTAGVMRRLARTRDTILIAYTALAKDHVAGRSHDFDGYCQKGQPIDSLVQLIRSFLHKLPVATIASTQASRTTTEQMRTRRRGRRK
jgi:CheY-like chemotaxis protein